jgi:copper(I)-binding protein
MWKISWSFLLLGLTSVAWAGPKDVAVDKVWVGESIPGQNSATLELNITTVAPATLLSVSSTEAAKVEIHRMSHRHGKMEAMIVQRLPLPGHQTVAFGSDRLFLIMVELKKEFNIGDHIPVSLQVEYTNHRRQTITVEATVKKMALSYRHLGQREVHDHR